MSRYLEWARHRPSTRVLVLTLILAGGVFLAGVPILIAVAADRMDQALGLPGFGSPAATIAGVLLVIGGGSLGLSSVLVQIRLGRGTPVPMAPTQRLVVSPPYTYCRNPMVLGTATAYFGVAVWLGSLSAITLVLVFASLLLVYAKALEEAELEARFGIEYLEYKRATPFLIPRFAKRPRQRRRTPAP